MLIPFLLAAAVQLGPPANADSVDRLRRSARKAEAEFERLSRTLVPTRFGYSGGPCDEIVGRFCLIYDDTQEPQPDPEHGKVVDARRTAIESLRAAFSYLPGDFATAAPLVRYLVEDRRASEAASAARLYQLASSDSLWGPLLLGFAAHAAGDDTTAERQFSAALGRMGPKERATTLDIEWLLDPTERSAYHKLAPARRQTFEHEFWALADPLYLTPGNESWTEHVARHVVSRMLARAPVVADMMRWDDDLEQLTVRYGVPVSRTRTPATGMASGSLVEHYDPAQLAYTPFELLQRGPPPPPLPGQPWELARKRSRSGYAPETVRRLVAMPHQVTRLPDRDSMVLRLDGVFRLDSVASGAASIQAGVFVLDSVLEPRTETRSVLAVTGDTARLEYEIRLPRGSWLYSLEGFDPGSRLGSRARYMIDEDSTSGPHLSDPLVCFQWGDQPAPTSRSASTFRPRADLTVASGDTLGLYAEASGLAASGAYRVQLSVELASRGSLPSRVVSWLGGRIGLGHSERGTRLEWMAQATPSGSAVITVQVASREGRKGDQVIRLRVTDATSNRSTETQRIIRVR